MRKIAVSGGITIAIALQIGTQVFETDATFWPFTPYHMYSDAFGPGSTFAMYELRAVTATPEDSGRVVTNLDASIPRYRFERILAAAADGQEHILNPEPDGAARLLAANVAELGPYETVELWERRYEIGPKGLVTRDAPRTLVRAWPVQ
ncbi:MAG: hypothetical protein MJB57_02935 [Gemmatimonadetes bacterium]|nr:hypothetical protein [Gemmatimonadota bacterium]